MRSAHTVEEVRAAEGELMAALPEGALMQRAAAGLATAVLDFLGGGYGRRVVLLVGSGDNGGDALYAGVRLLRRGAQVTAVLLGSRTHAGGLAAFRAAGGRVEPPGTSPRPDVVVDGIVGIGGRPGLQPNAVAAVAAYRGVPLVAVDVPSGVGVDSGELPEKHVRADLTVTFGSHKVAHLVHPAAAAAGPVTLVDIGLALPDAAVTSLQPEDVAALLPVPGPEAHKYTRGVVGVRAGSEQYPGAAVLAVAGADCGLAGMVRYVGTATELVHARFPEVVAGAGRVQAWVVGSGGGADAAEALAGALADGVPVVADADALAHLPEPGEYDDLVITPHAGELATLLDVERSEVEARGLHHARSAADRFDCVVVLKGPRTLVAEPGGRVRVNTTGVPWLATAGAGDVLAGLTGTLLAAGLTPFDGASVAAWLHGAAATMAADGGPITAPRVAEHLPGLVRGLRAGTPGSPS